MKDLENEDVEINENFITTSTAAIEPQKRNYLYEEKWLNEKNLVLHEDVIFILLIEKEIFFEN